MWYLIDAVDRIADVSDDWDAHARRGGAPSLTREAVLGRSIWSFIDGEATRFHYAQVFEVARQTGIASDHRLRADAPGRETLLELTIIPNSDQTLSVRVETLRERAVPLTPLPEVALPQLQVQMSACTWCKAIAIDGEWVPPLEAEKRRPELCSDYPPPLEHNICPNCDEALEHARKAITGYIEKLPTRGEVTSSR